MGLNLENLIQAQSSKLSNNVHSLFGGSKPQNPILNNFEKKDE